MPTLDNLTAIYRNVNRLPADATLSADAKAQLTLMANGIDIARGGQMYGDLWSYASAVSWIQGTVKTTTDVAVMSYGFLTNTSLGTAGLDYLVSKTGGNPNNLNSDYYAGFSLENRYINFAVNLAKFGDGKSAFLADYGEFGTAYDTYRKAYLKLFGVESPRDAVDVLSDLVPNGRGGTYTRGEYFAEIGHDGGNGVGTRAAIVGWLMAEAVKADKGPYVEAMHNYLADVGVDGKATAMSDFLSHYGKGGDYAPGGPLDPGLPGEPGRGTENIPFYHDWNVDAFNQAPDDNTHVLASDGNDVLRGNDALGLDANRHVATGAGNDVVLLDIGGSMRGHIDLGAGNDFVVLSQLDGRLTTGSGYDLVYLFQFAGMHLSNGRVGDIAVIDDFQKGFDALKVIGDGSGPGEKRQLFFITTATFDDALTAYAGLTAANSNTVFEWGNDTYIFHQNGAPGVDAGDGLIKLAGVTGLTVGKSGGTGDILFAA